MTIKRILGLFNDFDQATAALRELRGANLPHLDWNDVTIKSPICLLYTSDAADE